MSTLGSNDDCYFYYYSSCTKGDDCPFRHCEAALGTETVCSLWREGRCLRENCKFRHMESRINRGIIPCYWEDKPSGCLKPHCVFWHRKLRTNVKSSTGNEGLILPVSTTPPQISPSVKMTETKDTSKNGPVESYLNNIEDSDNCPASIPIEPIVFSFDNEESDSESASSTPVKPASNDLKANSLLTKKNLFDALSNQKNDLGIKTLEQIKMEKIHKESDNFYKSAYDAPLIAPPAYDVPPSKLKIKTDNFKAEIYPPKAEFISISSKPIESPISVAIESKDQSSENERNIRNRILKRRNISMSPEKSAPPNKVISLKKTKDSDASLDFKIKTLEEIRREKMNKLGKEETPVESSSKNVSEKVNNINGSTTLNGEEAPNMSGKPLRKLRIKRQSIETVSDSSSILQEADSSSDSQKKERNQMILHEVQNISEDKTESKATLGKRKEIPPNCGNEKSPKQLKSNNLSSPNNVLNAEESEMKQIRNICPVIKRKKSTSLLQPSASPNKEISSTVRNVLDSTRPEKEDQKVFEEKCQKVMEENNLSQEDNCDMDDNCTSKNEKTIHKASVDDIDNFLLNEAHVNLDYEHVSCNESDDLLLEIEQLLES